MLKILKKYSQNLSSNQLGIVIIFKILFSGDPFIQAPVEAFIVDIVFVEADSLVESPLNDLSRVCKQREEFIKRENKDDAMQAETYAKSLLLV